jgi:nucleotidyltransferase substrate binding protein (TIGR01987 family)
MVSENQAVPKRTKSATDKPRWLYRFNSYKRAYKLLSKAIDLADERELSDLEEEGFIQRFEYTWELAWKLLADLLDEDGVALETRTPKSVVRAAFAAKLIADGDAWMDALDARNKMAHTYNETDFEEVVEEVRTTYFNLFSSLHQTALARVAAL